MKQLILAFSLLLLSTAVLAQTRSINRFYNTYKHQEEVRNFALPGWLIRLGATIAKKHVDEPEAKAALQMAKKVKKLKLLVMENGNPVQQQDLERLYTEARSREGFEDMVFVREGNTRVNMLIRTKKDDIIRNLLIMVSEEDQFVMVSLKTKLKIEDLNQLLYSIQKDADVDIGITKPKEQDAPKEEQKEQKVVVKKPRA
ncbi:MAG: DUF4252 domain-containing protein [Bacteroidota bacterium]